VVEAAIYNAAKNGKIDELHFGDPGCAGLCRMMGPELLELLSTRTPCRSRLPMARFWKSFVGCLLALAIVLITLRRSRSWRHLFSIVLSRFIPSNHATAVIVLSLVLTQQDAR
jgi:hypothetical protein